VISCPPRPICWGRIHLVGLRHTRPDCDHHDKSHTFDTHTPGCGLVFRQDLEHEGTVVEKGEKYIVTANLWATRKDHTEQVLLVTFPNGASSAKAEGDGQPAEETKSSIRKAVCSETSYVLPVHVLSGVLQIHVEWANRKAENLGQDPLLVVEYPCTNFDFESFGTVAKILKRAYVDPAWTKRPCLITPNVSIISDPFRRTIYW
jgi:hypothetical protein